MLDLPLQADDDGWPASLQQRSDALPASSHPFVCAPRSADASAAEARIRCQLGPGHVRLLVSLRARRARVVDAHDVPYLHPSLIRDGDATAHALLEQLGPRIDVVYVPEGAAVVFTSGIGTVIEVRATQPVEVRRDPSGRRRVRVRDALTAFAWAIIVAVVLALFGFDGAIAGMHDKVHLDRLVGAELRIPVWSLVAAPLLVTGVVTALRHRHCPWIVETLGLPSRRAEKTDEHDSERLLPA